MQTKIYQAVISSPSSAFLADLYAKTFFTAGRASMRECQLYTFGYSFSKLKSEPRRRSAA